MSPDCRTEDHRDLSWALWFGTASSHLTISASPSTCSAPVFLTWCFSSQRRPSPLTRSGREKCPGSRLLRPCPAWKHRDSGRSTERPSQHHWTRAGHWQKPASQHHYDNNYVPKHTEHVLAKIRFKIYLHTIYFLPIHFLSIFILHIFPRKSEEKRCLLSITCEHVTQFE